MSVEDKLDTLNCIAFAKSLVDGFPLRSLDLGYNQVDDLGVWAVASMLKGMPNLTELSLEACPGMVPRISAVGAYALADALGHPYSMCRLRMILLANNDIRDEGARVMRCLGNIAGVGLGSCRVRARARV